jgi:hypothetical protein
LLLVELKSVPKHSLRTCPRRDLDESTAAERYPLASKKPSVVFLRATAKVLRSFPNFAPVDGESDTALGDWYVNRMSVDHQPLLLLVSARTLLPIVIPARNVRELPGVLPDLVRARLERLGVAHPLIDAEVSAMDQVVVTKTKDRSVVGIMVDFGLAIPHHVTRGTWNEASLPLLEARLARTPSYSSRPGDECVFPDRDTPVRLANRWLAG